MRLIRDGEKGVWRWGEGEIIYQSLHCHHQNDFCIKTGGDESRFNVSLTVRDKKSQDSVHRPQTLKRKETAADSNRGPSAYQPNALLLGHTGSFFLSRYAHCLLYTGLRWEGGASVSGGVGSWDAMKQREERTQSATPLLTPGGQATG